VEELAEVELEWDGQEPWHELAVAALDYARRPRTFEHRTPSFGAIIGATTDSSTWEPITGLHIERRPLNGPWIDTAYLYADGIASWIALDPKGTHTGLVFDRPAGSERDLVVIAEATGATIVQRHPGGLVRVVGAAGVHRWDGVEWQHQPPLASWLEAIVAASCDGNGAAATLELLLEFALHDLAARQIGATLVYRPDPHAPGREGRLPAPPPLDIRHPPDLAPLRHALGQIDGATVFDGDGVLREIGVRLVPSMTAEADVPGLRGMRHTSARRYSADDTWATVIVVSESGSVTVLRGGKIVGTAPGSGI
jgi:hypothetical protein